GHGAGTGRPVLGQWDVTPSDRGDLVTGPQRKYGRPGRLHGRGCLGGGGRRFGTAYLGPAEPHRSVTALGHRVVTQLTLPFDMVGDSAQSGNDRWSQTDQPKCLC